MREWATEWWNLEWAAQNIAANMEGTYLWLNTCGYYVNDYIYWVTWQKWPFGSEIASKRAACNNKNWLVWAKVWDAIVFDWTIAWWVPVAIELLPVLFVLVSITFTLSARTQTEV